MASWLIPVLQWCLAHLPISDILKFVLDVLRKLAADTTTSIDDTAVDFIEMVFQGMGLISKDVVPAAIPVSSKAIK